MNLFKGAFAALLFSALLTAAANASAPNFAAQLLRAHNLERAAMGAGAMIWDSRLAASADAYASRLARTGRWGHSPAHQRVGQGENLWMGSRGGFHLGSMVGSWSAEKRMFRAGVFPNVSRTGSWHHVGHYTQMIWPSTNRVGCSLRSSANWDYLVCRYSGLGNVMGARVGPVRMAAR